MCLRENELNPFHLVSKALYGKEWVVMKDGFEIIMIEKAGYILGRKIKPVESIRCHIEKYLTLV